MGLTVSWLAVQGAQRAEVLGFLGVSETGAEVFAGEAPMCCRQFPGDWLVIFNRDYDWADAKRVLAVSRFGLTIGCQFSEHVMESEARAARDGQELWSVSDHGGIEVSGAAPPEWAAIEQKLGEDEDAVDDAPQTLAEAICGFRVGENDAGFTLLEGAGAPPEKRGGLFASLFKKRG